MSGKVTTETTFGFDDVRSWVPQIKKENIIANQPVLDVLDRFALIKEATKAQISLAWMLHKYPHVVPIPGSRNQERIAENLGATGVELTSDEFAELEAALAKIKIHGNRSEIETLL